MAGLIGLFEAPTERRRAAGRRPDRAAPALVAVRADARARVGAARREVSALTMLVAGLTIFGLVMILSASSVVSIIDYGSPWSLFLRQGIWTLFGLVGFLVASRLEMKTVRRLAVPFLFITAALLFAVLLPGLGQVSGGSSRWIGAGPIKIQPSEFAKLAFVVFAADLLARRHATRDFSREVLRPLVLVLGLLAILILRQPDFGTTVVLACTAIAVLYAGGIERRFLGALVGVSAIGAAVVAVAAPYRRDRLLSFLNPFAHASTSGYQLTQSLASLGSGHIVGAGLGASVAKWFLPNAQTDFIFAVVGNEFGLVGSIAVVCCFVAITVIGIRIATRADDPFARFLATGVACWIGAQAFINIGGVIGVLPDTGIPLPFLSSGGSSLVVALVAMGLLVNVGRAEELSARPARSQASRRGGTRR